MPLYGSILYGSNYYGYLSILPTGIGITRIDVRNRLNQFFQNPNYYTSQDLNNSIQDGIDEVAATTGLIYKTASIPFAKDRTYYDMITLLPDYIGLVAIFNSVIHRWMAPTSIRKLDQARVDWEVVGGTPYYFVPVTHRYIAIYRKPLQINYGNMYVFYIAAAPTLDDSTILPIPEDHLYALESYCMTDLYEQNQEFSKAEGMLENYISNLEELRVLLRSKRNPDRQQSLR